MNESCHTYDYLCCFVLCVFLEDFVGHIQFTIHEIKNLILQGGVES